MYEDLGSVFLILKDHKLVFIIPWPCVTVFFYIFLEIPGLHTQCNFKHSTLNGDLK